MWMVRFRPWPAYSHWLDRRLGGSQKQTFNVWGGGNTNYDKLHLVHVFRAHLKTKNYWYQSWRSDIWVQDMSRIWTNLDYEKKKCFSFITIPILRAVKWMSMIFYCSSFIYANTSHLRHKMRQQLLRMTYESNHKLTNLMNSNISNIAESSRLYLPLFLTNASITGAKRLPFMIYLL